MTKATIVSRVAEDQTTFAQLALELDKAKQIEDAAKRNRMEAELRIIALARFERPSGSETFVDPDGRCKLVLTQPITKKVDPLKWLDARKHLPRSVAQRIMRTSYAVSAKELTAWADENPDEYTQIVAPCITTRPGKVSVKIEKVSG